MFDSTRQRHEDNFSFRKASNTVDNQPLGIYQMKPMHPIESMNEINVMS
jgi:hypothetical protein